MHLGNAILFSYTKLESNGEGKYTLHTPQAIDVGYNDNNEKIKLYATRLVLIKRRGRTGYMFPNMIAISSSRETSISHLPMEYWRKKMKE